MPVPLPVPLPDPTPNQASPSRATLALSLHCDNACRFCAQADLEADLGSDPDRARATLEHLRRTHAEVTFVGGEPTLVPTLPALVAHARDLGFTAIGLQTHGRHLADPTLRHRLVRAGLTDVHLSLHGATAAAHDYHTDRPGSFEHALAAAQALRADGVTVVVSTVITRSSIRGLDALAHALARLRVAAWVAWWPVIAGRAADAFDRTIPRFGVAAPLVLHAIASAMRRGIAVGLAGLPLCTLGPFAARALPVPTFGHAPPCDGCAARAVCPGLAAEYLAHWGSDELRRRDAPVSGASMPAHLARMFVGPGPLALRTVIPRAPSPMAARASLPILGKAEPARAEVRGRTRRSGEALHALFPELFGPEPTLAEPEPDDDGGATSPPR